MMLRGNRFCLRRHVPTDVQPIIGRAEVWRSLKTDSLQTALRRLPLMTAALESEFERVRHDAGLTADETILRPSEDDLRATLLPSRLEAHPQGCAQHCFARQIDDARRGYPTSDLAELARTLPKGKRP
jgi:hypothetical protein